jgi:hypothetical protein
VNWSGAVTLVTGGASFIGSHLLEALTGGRPSGSSTTSPLVALSTFTISTSSSSRAISSTKGWLAGP